MCVIERKTYFHTNGRQETIEKARPCHRAVGNRLCKHVDRRSFEAARIVETKPSTSTTPPDERDGYIVTEGSRGQQRMYRDLSTRGSSNSSSIRRSATMSDRTTPVSSTNSTASSPSYVEVKPENLSSSPSTTPGFPFGERTRMPYGSSKPARPSFTKDGTAIYERPPSLDQPRAFDNERPRSSHLEKESSFSSTSAEVGDEVDDDLTYTQRRHRPSVSFDSSDSRPATPSSSTSVPGLSQLKSSLRRDSGKAVDRKSSLRKSHRTSDTDRQRRRDREEEDDRRRDASRERHRREAAAKLEGRSDRERDDSIQRGREAERAAMEREREQAAQLRRDEDLGRQYHDDQLRREAQARRPQILPTIPQQPSSPVTSSRSPAITSARAFDNRADSTSTSARAFDNSTSTSMQPMPPRVHNPAPVRRASQTIAERGADVIARERARAAGQDLNDAMGGMSLQEAEAEEYQRRMDRDGRYGGGRYR